jgi:ribonuclease HII
MFGVSEDMPPSWLTSLIPRLESIISTEKAKPSASGTSQKTQLEHGKAYMYKWVDSTSTPITGIIGVLYEGKDFRMEITTQNVYLINKEHIYKATLPQELSLRLSEIFRCSQNRYTPSSVSEEPATGEAELNASGINIAGCDEAGRGSWAGPLTAAVTILNKSNPLPAFANVRDSKAYQPEERKQKYDELVASVPFGIGIVSAQEINSMNLDDANKLAFSRALQDLTSKGFSFETLLIDGANPKMANLHASTKLLIRGERISQSIAAASIIAKVTHDKLMDELSQKYPQYQFDRNQGYGTPGHKSLLIKHGVSPEHRTNFKPVKKVSNPDQARMSLD